MSANYFETDGAIPASVDDVEDTAGQSVSVSIKNTFIHMGPISPSSRRCTSMPPSLPKGFEQATVEAPADEDGATSAGSECMLACAVGSPLSTTTGSIATGSPCYTPPGSPDICYRAEWPPCVGPVPAPLVVLPPPFEATNVGPPRLKSTAAPYQPRSTFQASCVAEAIVRVATAAITAMMAHPEVQGAVRVVEDHTGWIVEAHVSQSSSSSLEDVLECAKAHLLEAAGASTNIYVMGYEAIPFQIKPDGFEATLGVMQDESRACWDSYAGGSCHRGARCRWQHPTCLKRFAVTARPSSTA